MSEDDCLLCEDGQYCEGYGNSGSTGIFAIGGNTVTINAFQTCCLFCLCPGPCDAGYWCEGGSYTKTPTEGFNASTGKYNGECPVGHYCLQGETAPEDCPIGRMRNVTGASSVDDCQPCDPVGFSPRCRDVICLIRALLHHIFHMCIDLLCKYRTMYAQHCVLTLCIHLN